MSRRRELLTRIEGLGEISGILAAMKGLALIELHRIGEYLEAQRQSVRAIETALADFILFNRAALAPRQPPTRGIRCIIGTERGFCGDINSRIVDAALTQAALPREQECIILVGEKLADTWPKGDDDVIRIRAPSIADEVPAALGELLDAVERTVAEHPDDALSLVVVHHDRKGVRTRQLLPLPEPRHPRPAPPFAPLLNLAPRDCFDGLADQYLYALLHAVFFDSLFEENRRRLQHMDLALHRLDEQLETLQRRQNQQRQEEIIEEIEVILLTAS